jgi:hypothetical protein
VALSIVDAALHNPRFGMAGRRTGPDTFAGERPGMGFFNQLAFSVSAIADRQLS